ncbi:hypothetical protein OROHE_005303 [Orobanche hederae]
MGSPFSQSPTMPDSWIPCSPAPTLLDPRRVRILIFCPFGRRGLDDDFDGGPFLGGGDPAAGNRAAGGRDDWRGGDEPFDVEILPSDACYSTPCCYVLARISVVQVGPKSSPGRPKSSTRRPMSSKSGDIFTHCESEWHDDLPPSPGRLVDD